MKTLIVEDTPVFQRFLNRVLSDYGTCQVAENGKAGLSAFVQAHQKNEPYDLIMLDIMLPGMNGLELLKKIRSVDTGTERVKIVMVTGVADTKTVQVALQLGCDAYIVKPLNVNEIKLQLKKLKLIE